MDHLETERARITTRPALMAQVEKKLAEALKVAARTLVEDVSRAPDSELRAGLYTEETAEKWVEETLQAVKFRSI